MAHADVPVDGQRHRQPDGRRVYDGRYVFRQAMVHVTPAVRHVVQVVSERVEVDETGQRQDAGQHVGERHGDEKSVGRVAHVAFEKDKTDERVSNDGEQDDWRRDDSVDWPAERCVGDEERADGDVRRVRLRRRTVADDELKVAGERRRRVVVVIVDDGVVVAGLREVRRESERVFEAIHFYRFRKLSLIGA